MLDPIIPFLEVAFITSLGRGQSASKWSFHQLDLSEKPIGPYAVVVIPIVNYEGAGKSFTCGCYGCSCSNSTLNRDVPVALGVCKLYVEVAAVRMYPTFSAQKHNDAIS